MAEVTFPLASAPFVAYKGKGCSSQRYGKNYAVPAELAPILKDFTREVLREQPEDEGFFAWSADYFERLLAEERAPKKTPRLSPEELEQLLSQMFREADVNGSGALDRDEFKSVLRMSELQLSDRDVMALIAEADLDGNGEIGYDEFIPLAVELVHNMYARMDAEAERETRERNAAEEAVSLIHGMNKEELEELLVETFRKADADGSGALSMEEFKNACFEMDIGLTRREVNILMHQCDIDGDGTISYEEFVPVCFEMLVEVVRRDILQSQRTDVEIERFLIKIWQTADVMNEGVLAPNKMSGALRTAYELPLTRLQIHSVLGEVSDDLKDSRGSVDYVRFAPIASKVIERMLLPEAQAERRVALQQLGGVPPVKGGRSEEEIHQTLLDEFRRADRMNTGVVTLDDFFGTLINSSLQLNDYELNMLASVMEFTQDDRVFYPSACEAAYGILLFCAEQEAMGQGLR